MNQAHPSRGPRFEGFTLIELVVVIIIVSILASVVGLNFMGADRERELQTEAERIALLIELARNESMQRNESWGMLFDAQQYAFAWFDPDEGVWRDLEQKPFQARPLEQGYKLVVAVENLLTIDQTNRDERLPDIVMFANGELTPFEIEVIPQWETIPWVVRSDGIQRTQALRANELEALADLR
ncbi:MAG: type II secretion system minor pseudopilin GspH [Gammaproteobacteria bacterium]|nr:type II secretion system minor pseudopilin GspH [Gammaproteobacteria bacterium]